MAQQISPELLQAFRQHEALFGGSQAFVRDGMAYQTDNTTGEIYAYPFTQGGTPTGTAVQVYSPDGAPTRQTATKEVGSFGKDLATFALTAAAMAYGIPLMQGAGFSPAALAGAAEGAAAAGGAGAAGAGAAAAGAAAAGGAAGAAGAAGGIGSYLGPAASVASGLIGANSASRAADAQRSATESANALLRDQFGQVRSDLGPYRNLGEQSVNRLSQLMGLTPGGEGNGSLMARFTGDDLENDPGYQFQLAEGNKALDRRFASGGNYFSGAALKGATRYAQDFAGTKFNEAFNRDAADKAQRYNFLSGGVSSGQNSAAMTGQAGQATAGAIGANTTNLGNALGGAAIAQGNALASGLSGIASDYSQRQMLESFNQRNNLMDRILAGNSGWGGDSSRTTGNGMPYWYEGR